MPLDPVTTAKAGFYGKLPARGDFLRDTLPRTAAAAWDAWMQAVLPVAQARLSGGWTETWSMLRPWRFWLGAGLCGEACLSGVWIASADRIGRPYPFLLAAQAAAPTERFLAAAETLAVRAVEGTVTPEQLSRALRSDLRPEAAAAFALQCDGARARWWRAAGDERESSGWPDADAFVEMVRS
ncbi:type VI secretion system-associated protein TagF [Methylobacterium variabile]|jgi:type VI secretion system protein ImpM|uniref:type VI secretion system-associated protein TagF n=1 Tax=Methylobacterium variabile TaxID=298794 RepID=UPI00069F8209|nr:type VI secretion system-associated protein TagF [Methylobacterium variabile]